MPRTLKIFEPTTFPSATSALPFNAPMKLTVSSGADVPTPIIAAPITKSETLNFLAMDTDPDTRKSAPKTIPAREIKRKRYSIYFNRFYNSVFCPSTWSVPRSRLRCSFVS